mmetsp:Transcript_27333/g.50113  ORF Transcript_27333/g.50113 Transcript_27333/m.50113 type:complete len:120 (-) Transcript_27333:1600-1959(-)
MNSYKDDVSVPEEVLELVELLLLAAGGFVGATAELRTGGGADALDVDELDEEAALCGRMEAGGTVVGAGLVGAALALDTLEELLELGRGDALGGGWTMAGGGAATGASTDELVELLLLC